MKRLKNNISHIPEQIRNSHFVVLFLCAFVFIFCIFMYSDTTRYGISGNDDDTFINFNFEKYSVKDIFTQNILFNNAIKTYYRPLLAISFMIDNCIAESPAVMHTTNIMLHALCSVLIFIFFKRYFFDTSISFFAAILFAAHPINIFTAAWIPGRNDSLLCVFFILSLIFFIEYLKKDKTVFLVFNFTFFAVALFIKEIAVIFPLMYLFVWFKENKKINRNFCIIFGIQFLLIITFFILYEKVSEKVISIEYFSMVLNNIKTLFDYYSAAILFKIHFSKYTSMQNLIGGIISICAVLLFSFCSKSDWKEKILYFCFPVLMLLISLIAGQMFFQASRAYIPLMFMIIVFVSFLTKYFDLKIVYTVLVALILLSSYMTLKYQKVFENEYIYFKTIDEEKPNYEIVMANLYSYNLLKYGKFEQAEAKAKEIGQITNYGNPYNLYVLSVISMYKQNFMQAMEYLEQIPNFDDDVYTKLTICYAEIGDEQKANYYYDIVLKLNGNNVEKTEELINREKQCFVKKSKVSY
mgnify:CR=1 FL=1